MVIRLSFDPIALILKGECERLLSACVVISSYNLPSLNLRRSRTNQGITSVCHPPVFYNDSSDINQAVGRCITDWSCVITDKCIKLSV